MLSTLLPLVLPDFESRPAIAGSYLYYNTGDSYTLPNGLSYTSRIAVGSVILLFKEWAATNNYVTLSGTTDLGQYICYYDYIPSHPRDYFIDQYDYTVAATEFDAVILACENIYSQLLETT